MTSAGDRSTIIACPVCAVGNRVRATRRGTPRCAKCKSPLPWTVNAGEATFEEEACASVPVVVDFWAPWCGPCRMVSPVLDAITAKHAGRIKLVKVNVDENPALAARFGAMSIPLLVVIQGGDEVDRVVGALSRTQLEARLAPLLEHAA